MKIINKIIATVVVIMMILFNSMAFAVEVTNGTVNTETLRLRKEASTDSIVLELLSKDDKVEILEEKGEWYKVKFKDYTGYVSKEFITKSGEVKSSTSTSSETKSNEGEDTQKSENDATQSTTTQSTTIQATIDAKEKNAVTNESVKVYILPLINSNIVTSLEAKTSVKIVNIAGGWAYVNANEVNGWIRLDKLSMSESSSESNVNNSETDSSQSNADKTEESTTQTNKTEESNKTEFLARNAYIKSSSVNVRSSASTSSQVVTTVSQNTQVKLIGEENDWYKVQVNNKNGYILKTLVSDTKVEVTSRSATLSRETTKNTGTNTNTNTNTNTSTNTNASNTNTTSQTSTTSNSGTKTQEQQTSANTISQVSSSKGEQVIAYAKNYLGCKYVYGGSGPSVFDCSGFTMYVYKHFGYSMGHSAVTQAYLGTYVPRSNLQPGDLIIFNNQANTSIGHVGIYVGGGNFIHASSGSGKIIISPLSNAYYNTRYVTARRIFN